MAALLERDDLLAELESARAEGGRLLFVGAGVGKTALVRVSAILRKLQARSRGKASAAAFQLGLLETR